MKTVKDMLAEAHSLVPKVSAEEAKALHASGEAIFIDLRDSSEVQATGKVQGALNINRGMLEFRADPESPYHEQALEREKTVVLYCASGGRAALAGKVLLEMGYSDVKNLGGFKDWSEAGGAVELP